jgi:hypothetical protein
MQWRGGIENEIRRKGARAGFAGAFFSFAAVLALAALLALPALDALSNAPGARFVASAYAAAAANARLAYTETLRLVDGVQLLYRVSSSRQAALPQPVILPPRGMKTATVCEKLPAAAPKAAVRTGV